MEDLASRVEERDETPRAGFGAGNRRRGVFGQEKRPRMIAGALPFSDTGVCFVCLAPLVQVTLERFGAVGAVDGLYTV